MTSEKKLIRLVKDKGNKAAAGELVQLYYVVTIAFIISTIFIDDNKNKTNYLQYSSKIGRKLSKKKIAAGMISALIVVTVEIIVFFLIYSQNNTLKFWNCSINSVFADMTSWFNLTFGQYIILSVVLMYIVALIVASISIFVSSKANSYIALIGIQVPVLGLIIAFLMNRGMKQLTTLWLPKYALHMIYGISVVISIVMIFMILKKEKIKDILN